MFTDPEVVPGKEEMLGATIVGEHAGDLLAEYVLTVKHGLGLNKILGTTHTYPTMSEANKYVAGEWRRAHAPQRLLAWAARFHAWQTAWSGLRDHWTTRAAAARMTPFCTVIMMAKAPVAGYAKTRLIPALGSDGAARLAERLLERAVDQALKAALGPVEICCAPYTRHCAFERLARQGSVALTEQGDGDLGACIARALERALGGVRRAVLIGTDAPELDASVLCQAAAEPDGHDAVFVPALDGGSASLRSAARQA